MDTRHQFSGKTAQRDQLKQVLRCNRDIGNLTRDCRAGGDGNAGVRLGERGGIVHAVADHDYRAPGGFFRANERRLVLRQNLGVDLVHTDLCGNCLGGLAIVARHHDDLVNAAGMQRAHGICRFFAQRVVDADHGGKLARDAKIQMRIRRRQRPEFFLVARRHMAAFILEDEVRAADDDLFALDHAGDAVRDDILHLRVVFLVAQSALLCRLDHGVCHRVRVVLFQARGKTQHVFFFVIGKGDDVCDFRRGVGERAGLVEDDGVCICNCLEESAALDGDVGRACLAHGGQNRNRHGKLERAREIDHQHGKHLRDVPGQQIRQYRAAQRIGNKPVCKARRLVLGGGLELFGLFDHFDDAIVSAAAHRLFHAEDALTLLADGACVDKAAFVLDNRHRLSGHGRLVDHCLALDHLSVERDEVAGADDHEVAFLHGRNGHKDLGLTGFDPDLIDIQRHRAGKVGNGLLVRPLFENLAEAQHEHHGACGVEIAAHHRDRHGGCIQHGDGELSVQQRAETFLDILDRTDHRDDRADRKRQE